MLFKVHLIYTILLIFASGIAIYLTEEISLPFHL